MPRHSLPYSPGEVFIIIVTYQSADHIQACLASLPQAGVEKKLTILVVDNGSSDGTPALLAEGVHALAQPRVTCSVICNRENSGFTRALNQGLSQRPAGAAVLFLNPDTILPPDSLTALLQALYVDQRTGVVAPQLRFPPASSRVIQPSCRRFPTYWDLFCEFTGLTMLFPRWRPFNRWKMGDFDHCSPREVDQPQGACLLARPEVVTQLGAWDERFPLFFSDVDWCRRVWQAGWTIRFEPGVFVWHTRGASVNKNKPAAIWSSHVSFWRYFRKWRRSLLDEILSHVVGLLLLLAACWRILWHFLITLFGVATTGRHRLQN
ncbi:MAG: glycosyltransferase family 2 protein [bacterium]